MFKTNIKTNDGRQVLVREPKESDLEGIWNFICRQFTDDSADGLGRTEPPTLEHERKWFDDILKNIDDKKSVYLLLEHENNIIGSSTIERKTGRQNHIAGFGIVIDKEFRRRGLGIGIMPIIIGLAKERMEGLKIIFLEVFSYNEAARGLYTKAGFKEVATIPDSCINKGKVYDKHIMYYYL